MIPLHADLFYHRMRQNLFIIFPGVVRSAQDRFRHDRPTVCLTEDARIFGISRRKSVYFMVEVIVVHGIAGCVDQQSQARIKMFFSAVHRFYQPLALICICDNHPTLRVDPYPCVFRRMRADRLSVVIYPAQIPVAVPSVSFKLAFLIFNKRCKAFNRRFIAANFGKLRQLS